MNEHLAQFMIRVLERIANSLDEIAKHLDRLADAAEQKPRRG